MSRRMYVVLENEYRQVLQRKEIALPKDSRYCEKAIGSAMNQAMDGWSILPGDSVKIELLVV